MVMGRRLQATDRWMRKPLRIQRGWLVGIVVLSPSLVSITGRVWAVIPQGALGAFLLFRYHRAPIVATGGSGQP